MAVHEAEKNTAISQPLDQLTVASRNIPGSVQDQMTAFDVLG